MGRYLGSKCRLCRREAHKLFLKGERCFTDKCAFERRKTIPGMHGAFGAKRLSEYGLRLREKQKAKKIFGLSERQFRRIYNQAVKSKTETGEVLFQKLEMRLDSVVYHLGVAKSRTAARQLISHRHLLVNGKTVSIPSYELKEGSTVAVAPRSLQTAHMKQVIASMSKTKGKSTVPAWISFDPAKLEGKILYRPSLKELGIDINIQYIIEFYSR